MIPRGIRMCNPGNIRISATRWAGKVTPSRDPEFETFETPFHGLRAIVKTVRTYEKLYGLNTVSGIIRRWAPDTENDTGSYISVVAANCGVGIHEALDLDDADTLLKLVKAIVRHECGRQPYSDAEIRTAIASTLTR